MKLSYYYFIILQVLFFPQQLFSQGWEKNYSDVEVTQIFGFLPSADGGYVIAGHTAAIGKGSEDGFLMKIDSLGNKQWFKTYGGKYSDRITGMVETEEGYILVGSTLSFGGSYDRVYIVKTDFDGNQLMDTVFHKGESGDDRGWGIIKTSNNRYLIHASTPVQSLHYQFNLIEVDKDLTIFTDKHYGGPGVEYIYKLIPTSDKGYIALGTTSSFGAQGNGDIYLLKLDSLLNGQWSKTYGGENTEVGFSLYQTSDGGYFIGSRSDSHGLGGNEMYMLRTDKDGEVLWTKTFGTPNHEYHGGLLKATKGGYYITATYNAESIAVAGDLWLLKVDEDSAKVIWDKKYGQRNDMGRFILETSDLGIIVVGTSSEGTRKKYVYVVRTDEKGNSSAKEKRRKKKSK